MIGLFSGGQHQQGYPYHHQVTQDPSFPEQDVYGRAYASLPLLSQVSYSGGGNPQEAYWQGQTYVSPGGLSAAQDVYSHYGQVTPEQMARYGVSADQGELDMIRATAASTLANKYFQQPGYQLLFGSGPAQMNPLLSPTQRFVHSPGYQYAVDEALRQVNRGSAARGLLESGRTQRDLLNTSQGMALQDYYNWWDRQAQNYENYQNRLAALASAGMGATGGQGAFNLGQNQAQVTTGMGTNRGSLLANQGSFGGSAMMNTAAAQAANIMSAGAAGQMGGTGFF